MSSILFANPFATQTAPQPSHPLQPQDSGAVSAISGPNQPTPSGDANASSGSGLDSRSESNQQSNATLAKQSAEMRSDNATPGSVVNAQAQASVQSSSLSEARARRSALALMKTARDDAILSRISTPVDVSAAPSGLPKIGMPDPLPTSPYLKPSIPE